MVIQEKNKEITVGVDVGNGTICTANVQFRASIKAMESAVAEHKAFIDGKNYVIGEEIWSYKADRTVDENAKLITHYAVARELMARGLQPGEYDIALGVGLPFKHWASLKGSLKQYYRDGKSHTVHIGDKKFVFEYKSVTVMPQGYSALVNRLNDLQNRTVFLVDIGEGTMDVVLYENSIPKETDSYTVDFGVKKCHQMAQSVYQERKRRTLSRNQFEQIIAGGSKISSELKHYAVEAEKEYSKEVMNILTEHSYNPDSMSLFIMGGGANIVMRYGGNEFAQAEYLLDQKANAKGYEAFMRMHQEKKEARHVR